ncbi:MAG: SusC/RagA family TonB-linked outer membrane protein [Muribaculaceae bacterium]|nr:SusC/RagA family TonB-linked outer membrane protein [Muribaculaceae bacterium]
MKKQLVLFFALCLSLGMTAVFSGSPSYGFTATAQSSRATGTVVDENGEPLIGVSVVVKGQTGGVVTDIDGNFSVNAPAGSTLVFSYVGYNTSEVVYNGQPVKVVLTPNSTNLDEVVVTALGIKKDRKSLGYALDELNSDELMKNKTSNAISSLAGKVAGVNITQSSGAAGSGAQIILRGATSAAETKDSQPLFVVDGIIYDNSSSVGGNSAFDGSTNSSTTSSNRVMDINPEDIESMSILKGPAASALYGSRAANGVVLITTKKGKAGTVEVNLSARYISSWVKNVPKAQTQYKRGYMEDLYSGGVYTGTVYNDYAYTSWGEKYGANDRVYDNIGNFFQNGGIWDTNVSVAGGTENSSFYLSGSYYDQTGVVPETGYSKATFRFNGEQKWKMFTFGANAAYSQANTDKTLTSGGLYNSSGDGALTRLFNFGTTDDMRHYLNEDGTRYRMFGDRLDPWNESDNPYWIINKNKLWDKTRRFTGNFSIKADITDWWWVSYRLGIDTYTTDNNKTLAAGGVAKLEWQDGMMSNNTREYQYLNHSLMTNFNKQFGDFNLNLLAGLSTDDTHSTSTYRMAYGFQVPDFFSYDNAPESSKKFSYSISNKRLVGLFGEFRADWRNTVFLTVTGRNDWTSTLPLENRSYFYPSVSGALVFTELIKQINPEYNDNILTFGKIRASWAKVGKDTGAYETNTDLWPVGSYVGGMVSLGNTWTRGNPYLKPEMTESTEIGLELRLFKNRLKFDYAYYTNNSFNQILSPRGPQSTGYIFCSFNAGNVLNKGMELMISGTPVDTRDWTWETGINMAGNRGRLEGLLKGMDIMYVTDVQFGTAQAASFSGGDFMAISGTKWQRVKADDPTAANYNNYKQHEGKVVLNANGMPLADATKIEVGNRESTFTGGWTNTLRFRDFTLDMLWEFRVGGDVYNGTKYTMTNAGTSQFSADVRNQTLVIDGVENVGTNDNPIYEDRHYEFAPDQVYTINGTTQLGYNIIKNYYTSYYGNETANYITKVNSLRLRTLSLSYSLPKSLLAKTKAFKRAVITASASNLLLFTNYDGDPEAAASGAGVGGSSSVGFDYCGVPATASFAFGINLTF